MNSHDNNQFDMTSAQACSTELLNIERQILSRKRQKSPMLDRLRLVNNSLDVYFSSKGSKEVHQKMHLNILMQISDLNFHLSDDKLIGEYYVSHVSKIKNNAFKCLDILSEFINKRNFNENKDENNQFNKDIIIANDILKTNPFVFFQTPHGFDRFDAIEEINKDLFALSFNEMKQLINEIKNDMTNFHNYFPQTFSLVILYESNLKSYKKCNVIRLWSLGLKINSSFKTEKTNCESDLTMITYSLEAFQGLNGAIISCFKEGRSLLESADKFRVMNKNFSSEQANRIDSVIDSIAGAPKGLVTNRVSAEATQIKNINKEEGPKIGNLIMGRDFSTALIVAFGIYVMKSAVSGSIGNAAYDNAKLISSTLEFLRVNKDMLSFIFAEAPHSAGWTKAIFDRYIPQLEMFSEKKS